MKVTMPKEIGELSASIVTASGECEKIRSDIARAERAVQQARGIASEIEAVTRDRAERKAMAFVSGQPADLVELDKQLDNLERANRTAIEDGIAAELAIDLLQAKLAQCEEALTNATERRRQLALAWLEERREKALDRYVKALDDLAPLVAEMRAADRARSKLGYLPPYVGQFNVSEWLLEALREENALPIPISRHIPFPPDNFSMTGRMRYPLLWMRDPAFADREYEQFVAELQSVGALPK